MAKEMRGPGKSGKKVAALTLKEKRAKKKAKKNGKKIEISDLKP